MKLSRNQTIAIAISSALALAACGDKQGGPSAEPTPATTEAAAPPPVESTAPTPASGTSPETAASPEPVETEAAAEPASSDAPMEEAAAPASDNPLAGLPAPYNMADYDQGRRQFSKCRSCHLIEEGAGNRVGPNLHGVFDRHVGAVEDFKYSKAVQAADFFWTPDQLDHWLANPKEFLPGNRMTFAGIANEEQRRNLIAYLMVETKK